MDRQPRLQIQQQGSLPARLQVHSIPFLASLLGCSEQEVWQQPVTFQVFDDMEGRLDPKMARTLHGSLSALAKELDRRNQAGAGIFLAVNATDGAGRSKANIIGFRSWWADLDGPDSLSFPGTKALPLPPSLRIQSGHGVHLYWCAQEPMPCAGDPERQKTHEGELRQIQKVLKPWGADPTVCEVARVMRLPGFFNRKREPHILVELAEICPVRYTQEEIRTAFKAGEPASAVASRTASNSSGNRPNVLDRARAYASVLAREAPAIAGTHGHATTLTAAIKVGCGFDLEEESAYDVLWQQYNPACRPPWNEEDLRRKVKEALKVCANRGWLLGPSQGESSQVKEVPADPGNRVDSELPLTDGDPGRPCFPPYRLDSDGLWFLPKGKVEEDGSESPAKPQRLCGPFRALAETRDIRWQGWGLRIRWQDPDGVTHEETIPREWFLGEGAELARTLIRGGLWVAPDETRRKKLVAYLASVRVSGRARSVERVGWHGGAFVLPGASFGALAQGEQVYLALDMEHSYRVRGDLVEWQQEVGRHATGNSRLTFALAAAFAAPLLGRLGMEGGGFHFFGQSSKGKTTCVEAAGSVWGGPIYRESWRATSNGLEAVAMSHCDCLLILDEQGQALPKESGEVAYLLANGTDKVRATKALQTRSRRRWRTLFLSTGEITLGDRMREEGRAPKAGQDVRMVDIPVLPEGLDQAFECSEGFSSSKAMADHLRVATRRCYGSAARHFLDRLCQATDQELLAWERQKVAWSQAHLPRRADSQVGRVLDRFALVALAGELAIQWGILPIPAGGADWAADLCLKAWIAQRGGVGAGEHERGIAAVVGFIERHGTSRFADWAILGERVVNSAGFRRRDGQDRMDYLFHTEGWKDACEGFNPKDVARGCAEAGLLGAVMESGKLRFQKNVKVPGRGTERFYIVTGCGLEAYRARLAESEG